MIEVKWEHIVQGIPSDSSKCMVALALQEYYGPCIEITPELRVMVEDELYSFPEEVIDNIVKFDEGRVVEPFKFQLIKEGKK